MLKFELIVGALRKIIGEWLRLLRPIWIRVEDIKCPIAKSYLSCNTVHWL